VPPRAAVAAEKRKSRPSMVVSPFHYIRGLVGRHNRAAAAFVAAPGRVRVRRLDVQYLGTAGSDLIAPARMPPVIFNSGESVLAEQLGRLALPPPVLQWTTMGRDRRARGVFSAAHRGESGAPVEYWQIWVFLGSRTSINWKPRPLSRRALTATGSSRPRPGPAWRNACGTPQTGCSR